ncbi:MAG: FtsK/SpoIIIE domain-containing protein [Acidimicrobiia bacterium]
MLPSPRVPPLHLVVLAADGVRSAITIDEVGSDHLLADLIRALRLPATTGVRVDGALVPLDTRIVDAVVQGSTIEVVDPQATRSSSAPLVEIAWCSGPDAGRHTALARGRHVVGRNATGPLRASDPAMAPHHAVIEIGPTGELELTDLGLGRPVELDRRAIGGRCRIPIGGRVGVGASVLEVVGPRRAPSTGCMAASTVTAPRPTAGWTTPYRRPPRTRRAVDDAPLDVPAPAGDWHGVGTLGVISLAVSLVGGLALALVLRQPLLFLMVGLGALGGVVTWGVQWVQARRGRRAHGRDRAIRFAAFETDVRERWAAAVAAAADHPSIGSLVESATAGSGLWSRRSAHGDAYVVSVGTGDAPWEPPLVRSAGRVDPQTAAVIERFSVLPRVPSMLDLGAVTAIGVVGDPTGARSLVRSIIVQLAVMTGPADWELLVVAPSEGVGEWDWTAWLPHTADDDPAPIAHDDVDARVRTLALGAADRERRLIVVVDGASPLVARTAPLRRLAAALRGSITLVVLASDSSQLPAVCELVVDVSATGDVAVLEPGALPRRAELVGCSADLACTVAARLARWRDPELHGADADLASSIELSDLIDPTALDPVAIAESWQRAGRDPRPVATLGRAADGAVEIDLLADGPHALVAGTTGAGKSELLRTLVASLALGSPPTGLSFVLVDYKGGSAFDACAALPHVVGVVTDLDDRLAARVLRSLDAELRRRERLLRAANAADLTAYRAGGSGPQIARLVIVVDEFAALSAELPEFLSTLVNVAQRGRSLGVHLVLATQRPSGVLSDDIRANTNLRIALRVQDDADAVDVVGETGPARFARHAPGRAALRLGTEDVLVFQTARCTGAPPTPTAGAPTRLVVRAGGPGRSASAPREPSAVADDGDTMLDVLVRAISRAASATAATVTPTSQRPWLQALPAVVPLGALPRGMAGLVDDPDRQEQRAHRWNPAEGHLLLAGAIGSGTTTALTTIAHALAAEHPASALHLYVLDAGAGVAAGGALDRLRSLPHVGAVVGLVETTRRRRLLHRLDRILDERAAGARPEPTIVLLVDGFTSLRSTLIDAADGDEAAWLERIVQDGPRHGLVIAASIDQPSAVPLSLLARTAERWVFRLADPIDASLLGVTPGAALGAGTPPGRCIVAGTGLEMQLACRTGDGGDGVIDGVDGIDERVDGGPEPIPDRPSVLGIAAICDRPSRSSDGLWLPVGVAEACGGVAGLRLHPGEHVFVGGAPRSGRTTALATFAAQWRAATPSGWVGLVAPRSSGRIAPAALNATESGVGAIGCADDVLGALADVDNAQPALLVVDDAELVHDESGALARLLAADREQLLVIAAGRPDAVRSTYGHWTAAVRRSRKGVLLGALHDLDGDVLGVLLPRRGPTRPRIGDGLLVAEGTVTPMQLAVPCG